MGVLNPKKSKKKDQNVMKDIKNVLRGTRMKDIKNVLRGTKAYL